MLRLSFAALASLCLAIPSTALSEPVSFGADAPFQTVRGLVVDDSSNGVVIIQGNDYYEAGAIFTEVNGQQVKTAREFSMLVSAAVASGGGLKVTSKQVLASTKPSKPPIPPKDWARSLVYSDTPAGVVIDYSLDPEEIGGTLQKFNDESVTSAADLHAKLAAFIAAPPGNFSKTISYTGARPSGEKLAADAISDALPAIAYSPETAAARRLMLDTAVRAEPPRPTDAQTEEYARAWGPLAKLAGRIYIGDIFDDTCQKAGEGGNSCYVMIWWQKPGQVLARLWFADLGYLVAADTILPTGKPGLFEVDRWVPQGYRNADYGEVGSHYLRITRAKVTEQGFALDFSTRPHDAAFPGDDPQIYGLSGINSRGHYRSISSYSRTAAITNFQEEAAAIKRSIEAEKRAERQRERDATMASVYGALTSVGSALNDQYQQQQAQFNAQLHEMQQGKSSNGANGPNASSAGAAYGAATSSSGTFAAAGSAPSLTRKTLQVYFYIGTTPTADDGHNTHCQSNIFPVTIDWDPSLEASGGNLRYANPVLDAMKSSFIDKCNRTGPSRPTEGVADWYADAFSGWHPEGRQLRTGDLEVTMP